jgi:hypothetical protein
MYYFDFLLKDLLIIFLVVDLVTSSQDKKVPIRRSEINRDSIEGATFNLDSQTPGVLREIRKVLNRIKKLSIEDIGSEDGFHRFEEGSALEGYFTVDIKPDINRANNDDNAIQVSIKALFKTSGNSLRNSQLIGVVNDENVVMWDSVPHDKKDEFIKVKNSKGDGYGFKAFNNAIKKHEEL